MTCKCVNIGPTGPQAPEKGYCPLSIKKMRPRFARAAQPIDAGLGFVLQLTSWLFYVSVAPPPLRLFIL